MMNFFTSVLVQIISLVDASYAASIVRVLCAYSSETHVTVPVSRRRARNYKVATIATNLDSGSRAPQLILHLLLDNGFLAPGARISILMC